MDPKLLDDLARRLAASMPEGLRSLQEDLEANFRSVLQSALGRLDLVTREDFEVQSGMLRKARKELAALERRLAALESRLEEGGD